MSLRRHAVVLLLALPLLGGCGRGDAPPPLRVAVAANFAEAFAAIAADWRDQGGPPVDVISGSTGALAAQVLQGAPYDLLLAADADRPARLAEAGVVLAPPRDYALGVLVLWRPRPEPDAVAGPSLLDGVERLAVANPDLAPYGRAAMAVLDSLGRRGPAGPRLLRGNSVAQAWEFAATGNADAAFVAASQVRSAAPQGLIWRVPPGLHPPIRQQAVLLSDDPRARALLDRLCGPRGRELTAAAGYALPTNATEPSP